MFTHASTLSHPVPPISIILNLNLDHPKYILPRCIQAYPARGPRAIAPICCACESQPPFEQSYELHPFVRKQELLQRQRNHLRDPITTTMACCASPTMEAPTDAYLLPQIGHFCPLRVSSYVPSSLTSFTISILGGFTARQVAVVPDIITSVQISTNMRQ